MKGVESCGRVSHPQGLEEVLQFSAAAASSSGNILIARRVRDQIKAKGWPNMDRATDRNILGVIGTFVRALTALEVLAALLVIIPLTVWLAWRQHSTLAVSVVLALFCISFGWLSVSILRWQRAVREMGWSSPGKVALGLGRRPEDPDELHVWELGIHCRYSSAAVVLCMAALPLAAWLTSK
jgi:hypothetical protein